MKKKSLSIKFWKNFALFQATFIVLGGVLIAGIAADHNIDGSYEFGIQSETKIADESYLEKDLTLPLETDGSLGDKEKLTAFVYSQPEGAFDQSFNEWMIRGIADFLGVSQDREDIEANVQINGAPNTNVNSYLGQYQASVDGGFKVTTGGAFPHISAIDTALKTPGFEHKWILVDEAFISEHVASAVFRADQSSFLMGVATGIYLNLNYDTYKAGGLKAGTYGGLAFDPVVAYMGGYQQGLYYWNDVLAGNLPNMEHQEKVEFIDLGDFNSFFAGGFEPDRGIDMGERMLNLGADAILPVAGGGREVMSVINQRREPTIFFSGEAEIDANNPSNIINLATGKDMIPFSQIKKIQPMTENLLNNIYNRVEGINPDNGVAGLGWINVGDLDNNLVAISNNGRKLIDDNLSTEQVANLEIAARAVKNVFEF